MRVGNFKVGKTYPKNGRMQWAVLGKRSDGWIICFDETRKPKELLFDFKYDACGYLWGFMEWHREEMLHQGMARRMETQAGGEREVNVAKKSKSRLRSKISRRSRRRNR